MKIFKITLAMLLATSAFSVHAAPVVIDNFTTAFDVSGEAGWNGNSSNYVGGRSGVTTLTQTGVSGAVGDRTTTFTSDVGLYGAVIIPGYTIESNGDFVASPGNGALTLNTQAGSLSYDFAMSWDVTDLDLSGNDRFAFNFNGDLENRPSPPNTLPFSIELTSGVNTSTAGVTVKDNGAYEILFSQFSGIDFADIDGITLLSVNNGVLSPDLGLSAVTAVPVPAAVWLFGSGLGLLGWMRRRKTV